MIDVVRSRDPYEPMAPYNGTSDEMKAIGKHLRDNGLYTMLRWNGIHTNPPLTITEERAGRGLRHHRRRPVDLRRGRPLARLAGLGRPQPLARAEPGLGDLLRALATEVAVVPRLGAVARQLRAA